MNFILERKNQIKTLFYFCKKKGPVVQLNRISDFGSEGYRFESCRGHTKTLVVHSIARVFLFPSVYVIL